MDVAASRRFFPKKSLGPEASFFLVKRCDRAGCWRLPRMRGTAVSIRMGGLLAGQPRPGPEAGVEFMPGGAGESIGVGFVP